jgi:hypothetical protein
MKRELHSQPLPGAKKPETLAVRFPAFCPQESPKRLLPRFSDLFPRRWRRRVVIQGQRFWLPG